MVAITVAAVADVVAVIIVAEEKMFVKRYYRVLFVTETGIVIEIGTETAIEILTETVTETVTATETENVAVTGTVTGKEEALHRLPGPEAIYQTVIPADVKKSSEYQMPIQKSIGIFALYTKFLNNLYNIVEKL